MCLLWTMLSCFGGIVLCVFLAGVSILCRNRQKPFDSAIAALSVSGDGVELQALPHGRAFLPTQRSPTLGLVYLPGALVDARAYAPLCRDVAKRSGCAVVLLDAPMRLSSIRASSRISMAMAQFPEITRWVIGGHSLGGLAATGFICNMPPPPKVTRDMNKVALVHPEVVGLILHASRMGTKSYNRFNGCARHDIPVLQVRAENDAIVASGIAKYGDAPPPENSVEVTILGGNHAGFGHYGPQRFPVPDGDCTIGLAEQQRQVGDATARWLKAVDQGEQPVAQ